jgi:hypothetical protein
MMRLVQLPFFIGFSVMGKNDGEMTHERMRHIDRQGRRGGRPGEPPPICRRGDT